MSCKKKHSDEITSSEGSWNTDHTKMKYILTAMGFTVAGEINLNNKRIILEGKIPLLAKAFSGKIEKAIKEELKKLFG